MINNKLGKPVSQRQLRVGEMIKQSLGMIFLRKQHQKTQNRVKALNNKDR